MMGPAHFSSGRGVKPPPFPPHDGFMEDKALGPPREHHHAAKRYISTRPTDRAPFSNMMIWWRFKGAPRLTSLNMSQLTPRALGYKDPYNLIDLGRPSCLKWDKNPALTVCRAPPRETSGAPPARTRWRSRGRPIQTSGAARTGPGARCSAPRAGIAALCRSRGPAGCRGPGKALCVLRLDSSYFLMSASATLT
jgi:hypothetical protein